MKRLEVYDRVNACETYEELAEVLRYVSVDEKIQGRTRYFDAEQMIEYCLNFEVHMNDGFPNILTREYGIRQQAMYIYYYTNIE